MLRSLKRVIRAVQGYLQNQLDQPTLSEGVSVSSIGTTVEGRSIDLISLGSGARSILVFGCIHGNEVGTRKTAIQLINWFAPQTNLHSRLTLYLIPVLNPDGFAQAQARPSYLTGGTIGRCNTHTIDLNRHFPVPSFQSCATWNRGANYREETNEVFAGDAPGTELEYRALVSLVNEIKPALVISLHNVGKDIMPNGLAYAHRAAERFSSATSFPLFPFERWKALGQTGTASEWFEQQNIPYLEIELPSRWRSCWHLVKRGFKDVFEDVIGP